MWRKVALAVAFAGCALALLVWWRFEADMAAARDRASQGSTVVQTNCGPIEYQEKGSGVPLLSVHGSGGGFDQGMAFAGGLAGRGTRVIAMSRFGYGTFAGAEYTAGQIKGARFIGFDQGGHTFVGHEDEVMVAILGLLLPAVPVAAP